MHGISFGFCTIHLDSTINDGYGGTVVASIASAGIATPYTAGTLLIAQVLAATLATSSCYNALDSTVYKVSYAALIIVFITLLVTFIWPLGKP